MPFRTKLVYATLIVLIALLIVSCGESTQSGPIQQTSDSGPIEDSGQRLFGEFVVNSVEDTYRTNTAQLQSSAVFTFDPDGNFKRQDKVRVEEGVYLISTQGELVIYVEKVNGEQLAAARVDRYGIINQTTDSISLQSSPSRKLVVRKR